MYTIKRAVELTGIPAGTLRAWENRYGIGAAQRSNSGYRVYGPEAIAEILGMKQLVEQGWSHTEAAKEIQKNPPAPSIATTMTPPAGDGAMASEGFGQHSTGDSQPLRTPQVNQVPDLAHEFLDAARALDEEKLTVILDEVFARGSFESVIDNWLIPTMRILGQEWVAGRMDIASEHFASAALMRRLGNALESSSLNATSKKIIIGTPQGSFHEMGALSLSVALRRRGIGVIYLGNNVPSEVWLDAVKRNHAAGVVIPVIMGSDVHPSQQTVDLLINSGEDLMIAIGGVNASHIHNATVYLSGGVAESSKAIVATLNN